MYGRLSPTPRESGCNWSGVGPGILKSPLLEETNVPSGLGTTILKVALKLEQASITQRAVNIQTC